jgi:hypothetical protein
MALPFSACIMIIEPVRRRLLHRLQDLAVRVEHARVGHEELEVVTPSSMSSSMALR